MGQVNSTTYDSSGRTLTTTDADGQVTLYVYGDSSLTPAAFASNPGSANQLYAKYYFDNATDYSAFIADPTGSTQPNETIVYSYYTAADVQNGVVGAFAGEVKSITDNLATPANGDPRSPYTNTTTFQYDANGNMTQESGPSGTINYMYDQATQRHTETWTGTSYADAATDIVYGYNDLGELASVTVLKENGQTPATVAGSDKYDASGGTSTTTLSNTVYTYDLGGRLKSSFDSAVGITTSYTYKPNTNDISTETVTRNQSPLTFAYDSQNRLVKQNAGQSNEVNITYNGQGNKVAETVNGATAKYLIDTNNPTGYSQIVEEIVNGAVTRRYTLGHWIISETQNISGTWTTSFYGYDGHNSVRFLTNAAGAVTDNYTFDASGIKIAGAGTTPNQILYSGEYLDPGTGDYNLRSRVYNETTGTFLTRDTYAGQNGDPITLHQYLYAGADPVMNVDPSGHFTQGEGYEAQDEITERYEEEHPNNDVEYGRLLQKLGIKPDIVDYTADTFYEIKPFTLPGISSGLAQMAVYNFALAPGFSAGNWQPEDPEIYIGTLPAVFFNFGGILFYTDVVTQLQNLLTIGTIAALKDAIQTNPQFLDSALNILGNRLPALISRGVAASDQGMIIESIDMDVDVALIGSI